VTEVGENSRTTMVDEIRRGAELYDQRIAFSSEARDLTFADVETRTNQFAHLLLDEGLRAGDRAALIYENTLESIVVQWGCMKAGVVPVTINPKHPPSEIARQMNFSRSRNVFVGPETVPAVEALTAASPDARWWSHGRHDGFVDVEPMIATRSVDAPKVGRSLDAEMYQFFGSGTTGMPKCLVETDRRWIDIADQLMVAFDIPFERTDVMVHIAPVIHAGGTMVLPHYRVGARNLLLPAPSVERIGAALNGEVNARLLLVPTLLRRLVDGLSPDVCDLRPRHIIVTSSPLNLGLLDEAIARVGPVIEQVYGFTEAGPVTILGSREHLDPLLRASVGRAIRGTEISVRDPSSRRVVAVGEPGEIWARGPGVFGGYWGTAELNAGTMRGDGWVSGGDIGVTDSAGYLWLLGRQHQMIITGGYNVYPATVERALCEHSSISEAAVVGVPDEHWGESLHAVLVARGETPTIDELVAHMRARVARFEVPKHWTFVDELPKSANGKVLYDDVKAPYWVGVGRRIH